MMKANILRRRFFRPDVAVIIRGVGERTEHLCYHLITGQIMAKNINVIHETPFSAALKKSFEIGLQAGCKWTLVVDADVLVRPTIVKELIARAHKLPSSVFALQTEMLDKFFGGIRVGGIKLYRTSMLEEAVVLVPEVDVRPETFVIKNMHKKGRYVDISDLVCGIHDFEQYYRDIFRKGFAHAIKHADFANILCPYWERMSASDNDFAVLLAGFKIGMSHKADLRLDKDEAADGFKKYATSMHLTEKPTLDEEKVNHFDIDKIMRTFKAPAEYTFIKAELDKKGRPEVPKDAK
jgi:hypothetical protein